MSSRPCQLCEDRPADLLVSLTSNGESEFVCLICMPFRVAEYYQAAGLPRLVFDVTDADAEAAGVGPAAARPDTPQDAADGPEWPEGAEPRLRAVTAGTPPPAARKSRPRRKPVPPPESEGLGGDATN